MLLEALRKRQVDDWWQYYKREPWGEWRADMRQEAFQQRLMRRCFGGNKEPPDSQWPYFPESEDLDPESTLEQGRNFDAAIEPKPGGGYQYTAEALKRMRELGINVDDNRQT